ncbi:septum formation protein Maf [Acinetobacter haemolyticus]|uniref:Maf family protein n=1 Tax=Acinetobacter haemolyticus TaxID=29430 RepID=UPI0002F60936|nr:Maf family protein [Acinetobacter haemolyticus]NAR50844.1 septum formation protein Maf [Acinetobacter haemolyticus]NAR54069.1 septum formation protein Maf [Acinetobacter haemolyticus]QHI25989.1 septum formation protein Maf [Acinetobacter haemolyticus]SUU18517.1 septum formation protein [Acinetobacter haemolyticus]
MMTVELILASSSQTRKELMDRLRLNYRCISPDIDESANGELHADDLAKRLAYEKARVIAEQYPNAIVIGSDQVAWREHVPYDFIGKPLTVENAIQQLQANSGNTVFFSTGLSVQHQQSGFETTLVQHYQVKFRHLTLGEIERYIEIDHPLHCAGSFKCESLGISLFEKMLGDDQTTLMGLPMIQLCKILREFGINAP